MSQQEAHPSVKVANGLNGILQKNRNGSSRRKRRSASSVSKETGSETTRRHRFVKAKSNSAPVARTPLGTGRPQPSSLSQVRVPEPCLCRGDVHTRELMAVVGLCSQPMHRQLTSERRSRQGPSTKAKDGQGDPF